MTRRPAPPSSGVRPGDDHAPAMPGFRRHLTAVRGVPAWFARKTPVLISRMAAVLGAVCLFDTFRRRGGPLLDWFTPILPVPARLTAGAIVTVSGLLLLRIAAGLRRRKRAEWRIAVILCAVLSVAHLLRDERRPVEAAVALTLLTTLIAVRSQFTARADPHSRWFAGRVCAQFLAGALVYGLIALELPGHVSGSVSLLARLREIVFSMVGLGGWIVIRDDLYADMFHATMLVFGLLTISCTIILLIRTSAPKANLTPDDEARIRELLAREGWRDSLGQFALRRDKSAIWSPTGKAAVTYRVVSGVALVSGDPIGDPEAWPGAIAAYGRLVEEHGWVPAVMGCSERGAASFQREYGLSALPLGDEAVLDVAEFSLEGRAMRGIRQACARLEREGYTVRLRRAEELSPDEMAELCSTSEQWRGDTVERGFSMALSRLGDPADGDCLIVTAHQDGRLRGLLQFVPWGPDGLSLDLMRRDRGAENGINELMIVAVMRDHVAKRVSMNFAAFRDPLERGERIGAGPLLRMRRGLLLLASRWWQIDSLYRFNAKFQPQWYPRFVSYPTARDIPRIALAALEAEAFIVRPHRLQRLLGRG